jgi:AraC family transcriptional regulator
MIERAPDKHCPALRHRERGMVPQSVLPAKVQTPVASREGCRCVQGGQRLVVTKGGAGLSPWQERRAVEMIMERLDGNIRLSDMARECGLSVSHFTRAFRKSFGMSPYRWLLERRIDRAKTLLVDSNLPIIDIAIRCGFSDQTAFTRAFGRIVGDSPGRWRRAATSKV